MYLKVCGDKSFLVAGGYHFFDLAVRLLVDIDLNDSVNYTDYQLLFRVFEVFRN